MKKRRLSTILRLINEKDIQTQTQLTDALLSEGFAVTQATVSRDINELGLIKIQSPDGGSRYASRVSAGTGSREHISIFSKSVIDIDFALHTVVLKTYPGMAQAVAASVDSISLDGVLGSIAGDDTILLITKSEEDAKKVCTSLEKMFE